MLFSIIAAAITISLFLLMLLLTSTNRPDFAQQKTPPLIDFVQIKAEQDIPQLRQRKLERKEPPKSPPRPTMNVAQQQALTPQNMPQMQMPDLNSLMDLDFSAMSGKVSVGATLTQAEQQLIPLVRVPPKYPMQASLDGVEGWVKLSFTITATGAVKDVRVIESKPRRIFDRAARRAIAKWHFKPQMVDGKPVPRKAVQTLDFKLQG